MSDYGNYEKHSKPGRVPQKENSRAAKPFREKRLLSPMERISEVLYGIIMALTFTGTLSIAKADKNAVHEMLIAALGCNIAWGIVDAAMYVLAILIARSRGRTLITYIRNNPGSKETTDFIRESLPPILGSVMTQDDLGRLVGELSGLPESKVGQLVRLRDFENALGIFLFVFVSTFPVAIPFLFVKDVRLALRISNLIAILLMFVCGWLLARYGGLNRLLTGLGLALFGAILVLVTIALGG